MNNDFKEQYHELMKIYDKKIYDNAGFVSVKEYEIVHEQIIKLFRKFLNKRVEGDLKKDKILALLDNFPLTYARGVADAVNCSVSYVNQVRDERLWKMHQKYLNIREELREMRKQYLDEHRNDDMREEKLEIELNKTKEWQLLKKQLKVLKERLIVSSSYCIYELFQPIIPIGDYKECYEELHDKKANIRENLFDLRERYFDEHGINDDYKKYELREEPENTKEYQSLRKRYTIVEEQIIELFRKFLDKEVESDLKKDRILP